MREKKKDSKIVIESIEYGEGDLKEIVLLQFIRWANSEKGLNLSLK